MVTGKEGNVAISLATTTATVGLPNGEFREWLAYIQYDALLRHDYLLLQT